MCCSRFFSNVWGNHQVMMSEDWGSLVETVLGREKLVAELKGLTQTSLPDCVLLGGWDPRTDVSVVNNHGDRFRPHRIGLDWTPSKWPK